MTRDEAKKEIENIYFGADEDYEDYKSLIDDIYNELESRTCANCIFFHGITICLNEENYQWVSSTEYYEMQVSKHSGCDKFKRKTY